VAKKQPNNLKLIRKAQGLSMIQLSGKAASVSTIALIENAGHVPRPELRRELAQALGVSETEIWPQLAQSTDQGATPGSDSPVASS
jgi:transcriptional regulator with XRE-family HTH domain